MAKKGSGASEGGLWRPSPLECSVVVSQPFAELYWKWPLSLSSRLNVAKPEHFKVKKL